MRDWVVHDDGPRWDTRYLAVTEVEPRAPEALDRWPELDALLVRSGRGLDIASGPGSIALWLAERGLDVVALDASGVAIGLLQSAGAAAGVTERIDARIVDLDHGLTGDLRELDVIICQRFRDPLLYGLVVDRLARGGIAVVSVLSHVGSADPGTFHAPAGELESAFGADERCEILRASESDGTAHIVVVRR